MKINAIERIKNYSDHELMRALGKLIFQSRNYQDVNSFKMSLLESEAERRGNGLLDGALALANRYEEIHNDKIDSTDERIAKVMAKSYENLFFEEDKDHISSILNLSDTTILTQVDGNSMADAGIFDKDFVIVDRAKRPGNGDIIVFKLNDHRFVKRLVLDGDRIIFKSENPLFDSLEYESSMKVQIIGKVVGLLRSY